MDSPGRWRRAVSCAYQVVPNLPIYLFGLLPFGIGIVLLLTSFTRRHK
jgi:hypothetical protein